jgi:hypothetical protein
MAKEMNARFPGTCASTGREIKPGDRIMFHGKGRSVLLSRSSSATAAPVSDTFTFSSGHTAYRNVNGRCEDAPCCGCCTI